MAKEERYFSKFIRSILPSLSSEPYDFLDKPQCISNLIAYTLCRTQSMFDWKNLPDSIPQRNLELMLQLNGNVCFYSVNGTLYVFTGGLGGAPNVYYMPTKYVIANPALNLSKTLTIDEDCVVVRNDSLYIGLLPLMSRYATAMTEAEISIYDATINSRIIDLIVATDDRTHEAAKKFLQDVIDGKLGVIAGNAFFEGIKAQPYGVQGHSSLTDLVELMQYHKASFFNELGLNSNFNMKRESINVEETQMNQDALIPLIDDMLRSRQEGCEKVNAMYGTNISVDFASAWKDNRLELDLIQKELSNQLEKENSNQLESNSDEEVKEEGDKGGEEKTE